VCAEDEPDADGVFDVLSQLIDKSLVVSDESGHEARFRMLESIRQYGCDKLVEAGASEMVRRRHLDFFLALVEQADPEEFDSELAHRAIGQH